MDRTLRRELKSKFNNYWFDTTTFKENIDLKIKYLNGYFQFEIQKIELQILLLEFLLYGLLCQPFY